MSFMSSNLHPLNTLSLPKSSLNILRHQVSILFLCDSVFGASAAEFKITDLDPFYISNVLKYRTDGLYGPFVLKIKISALLCGIEFSYSQYESPAACTSSMQKDEPQIPLIDIALNLIDPMFSGSYNGKEAHRSDRDAVLNRAWSIGVQKVMITGGSLEESREAIKLCQLDKRLFATVGVHPTRCGEFDALGDPKAHLEKLLHLINENKQHVVAVGEFGLDYDRVQFCNPEIQKKYFALQFDLADQSKLPLFLHMRNACKDLAGREKYYFQEKGENVITAYCDIIRSNRHRFSGGVVHSFTGTPEEVIELTSLDLYIGVNGCSLKTAENLVAVKSIPLNRLMLETDAPWCDIRQTHAGFAHVKTKWPQKDKAKWDEKSCVKGRNEPCHIRQVLEVVAGVKELPLAEVAQAAYQNTLRVFFPNDPELKK